MQNINKETYQSWNRKDETKFLSSKTFSIIFS